MRMLRRAFFYAALLSVGDARGDENICMLLCGRFFGNSVASRGCPGDPRTTRDSGDEISRNVEVRCVVENMAPIHASLVVPHRAQAKHLAATRNIVQIGGVVQIHPPSNNVRYGSH